jgi:hypothetical protein
VPVQVVYGARQVGAAGLGWDVPLTYIYHAKNLAHRRPSPALASQDRLTMMFGSGSIGLVRNAANTAWVARRAATHNSKCGPVKQARS